MLPYPYGHERDPSVCNFEKGDLVERGALRDQRAPRSA
jgi:formylglycine-generating enzyme